MLSKTPNTIAEHEHGHGKGGKGKAKIIFNGKRPALSLPYSDDCSGPIRHQFQNQSEAMEWRKKSFLLFSLLNFPSRKSIPTHATPFHTHTHDTQTIFFPFHIQPRTISYHRILIPRPIDGQR